MALSDTNVYNIHEGLKHKFLFNNDINCIHILLNLYDLEDNINNIYPKYISMNNLRRHISRLLKNRRGNYLIALNLGQLIHEDINRLELFLYLEGYKHGYFNNKWINNLEELAIKEFSSDELYEKKYLFNFETKDNEVVQLQSSIEEELEAIEKEDKLLHNSITNYMDHVIKSKVFSLNKYLDKQLTIEYNSETFNIKEDETLLTLEDLDKIYKEVTKVILRDGFKLYKEAYWNGVNDGVLKRYR